MPIYVKLNRKQGATNERVDIANRFEMILPIKTKTGFKAPPNIKDYMAGFAFKKYLEKGETILVNPNGGWNYLLPTDRIIELYHEK